MTTAPDEFEFDFERSRAAVAVACLQWLRCTGPAIEPDRGSSPDVAERACNPPAIASPAHALDAVAGPHPLWDRWLDG